MGLIPILRKGTRAKYQPRSQGLSSSHKREWFFDHSLLWEDERPWERGWQNIRLKAEITDYSHLWIPRLPRNSLTFGFPWTRPSVHSPVYQWNNCTSNITLILSTILTREYFDSTRFAYMHFSLSSSHALLDEVRYTN